MEPETTPQDLRDASASDTLLVEQQLNELREERDRLERERTIREQEQRLQTETRLQEELAELRVQVAALAQQARGGPAPPVPPLRPTPSILTDIVTPIDSVSQVGTQVAPAAGPKRRRFRDPEPFKGKTLREATIFISSLKVIFEIDPVTYETEREKVLFASTWLTGEPRALWSYTTGAAPPLTYTFEDFEGFVYDCVADPINRSLDVGQSYEEARQREGESVTNFAMHLTTLEDQFHESYTEAQRTRHLLNKLRPSLREAITLKADVPLNRRDLVAMAQRIENTARGRGNSRTAVDEMVKRDPRDGRAAPKKRREQRGAQHKQSSSMNHRRMEPASEKPDLSHVVCYNCGKRGHYKTSCTSAPQGGPAAHAQRKVGVSEEHRQGPATIRQGVTKKGRGRGKAHPST